MSIDLLVYALVATLSPLALAATIAVLGSGRLVALLFGIGFVVAQFATLMILTLAGGALLSGHDESNRLRSAVEVAFGVLLVAGGVAVRRHGTAQTGDESKLLARLRGLGPLTALAGGVLLGIGGPKRLVLTAFAATAIGDSRGNDVALAAVYTAIATLLVWGPILVFELVGARALAALERGQAWLARHQRQVASWSLIVIGAFAAGDGLAALL